MFPGKADETMADIEVVLETLSEAEINYVVKIAEESAAKIKPESKLAEQIKTTLKDRPLVNPTAVSRPKVLPKELVFTEGSQVTTRKATEAWFKWLMGQTAFFTLARATLVNLFLPAKRKMFTDLSAPKILWAGASDLALPNKIWPCWLRP